VEEQDEEPDTKTEEEEDELAQLRAEVRDLNDALLRKQAEFDNFRKRNERERQDHAKYVAGELLSEILPVIDNLERAIEAPAAGAEDLIREGIAIIHRQFLDILQKVGLREVDVSCEFDPHVHEAVGHMETDEHEEGEILEVYQKGYFLKDRLLRPAMVNVAKKSRGKGAEH
jgi:molecular chaperone GrpE